MWKKIGGDVKKLLRQPEGILQEMYISVNFE